MKNIARQGAEIQQASRVGFSSAFSEGSEMAVKEGGAAFESIEIRHSAEIRAAEIEVKHIQALGHTTLQQRDVVQAQLHERAFSIAEHLHQIARGKIDLMQALGLLIVSAALALFVLLAFGPGFLSILLALVIVGSAVSVEEFFQAHEEREPMREGIFLITSALALVAQFWLGVARGKLMAAVVDAGPISHLLSQAGPIVQSALGVLALVIEVLSGWKLFRARAALLSPSARAFRERERLNTELSRLGRALEAAKAAPEIRRHFRTIGARQQLAWAAGAEQRAHATHLKRAAKGALIALVILALLFLVSRLSAAPIPGRDEVVLLDLSKSVSPESLRASVNGVAELIAKLHGGDHLRVIPITDKFGSAILMDETMPDEPGYMGLQREAAREAIAVKWTEVAKTIKPTYDRTDVLGALTAITYLGNFKASGAQILIFSDLQQSTRDLDFEHAESIPVAQAIDRLKRTNAIPCIKGATIYALGVDPVGKSAKYYGTLREFWFTLFRESGAEVKAFSIDRHIP
jgi:hypothetical protein